MKLFPDRLVSLALFAVVVCASCGQKKASDRQDEVMARYLAEADSLAAVAKAIAVRDSILNVLANTQPDTAGVAAWRTSHRELLSRIKVEKDEFEGRTWYKHKYSPIYADNNVVLLYIGETAGVRPWLRMKVRYSGDDWIFARRADINVDGMKWELIDSTTKWERDNKSGSVWEYVDVIPTQDQFNMLRAAANSKTAVIRFRGDQYYSDLVLTDRMKTALSDMIELYSGLKGSPLE